MTSRLATMDETSPVSQLSLGEFRTVTRQVGRSRNGTNRKVRKQSKVKTTASTGGVDCLGSKQEANRNSNPIANSHSSSGTPPDGKPTCVDPNEPKLTTKSGKVPHSQRSSVSDSHGVHVTVKLRNGISNLRQKHVIEALERCFSKAKDRFEFELNAYTVMRNHFHFLVYVRSNEAL
ncbi:MAG: hypothetical protein ACI8TQ_003129 [Planctomycetota bacterium]|jgi:hypothetical protein